MNWKKWKIGLVISGITGVLTGVCGLGAGLTWKAALLFLLGTTAKDLVLYLAQHPYEKALDADAQAQSSGTLHLLVPFLAVLGLAIGCAHLQPGADPLVVRVEQGEALAQSTFQSALRIDNADRGFWRTNAPAFHHFCEYLRTPTAYQVTNTLPRYRVMLLAVDDVKLDYKAGRASSNALQTAFITLQGAMNQANAWLTIVNTK